MALDWVEVKTKLCAILMQRHSKLGSARNVQSVTRSGILSLNTSALKARMDAPFRHASGGSPALRQVCSRKVMRSH